MLSPALIATLLRPAKVAFIPSAPQATGPGGAPPPAPGGGAGAPPPGAMEMPPGAPPGDPSMAGAPPAPPAGDPAAGGPPGAPPADPNAGMPPPPAPDPSAGMPPPGDPAAGGETMVPLNAITNFATSIIEATKGKRTAEAAAAEAAADQAKGGAGDQPQLGAITGLPMGDGGASGPLKLASVIVRRAKLAAAPQQAPAPGAAPAPAPAQAPKPASPLSQGSLQPQVMAQRANKVTQFLKQQPPKQG